MSSLRFLALLPLLACGDKDGASDSGAPGVAAFCADISEADTTLIVEGGGSGSSGLLDGMPAFGQGYNLLIDGQLHYEDGNRAGHDPIASGRLMKRLCRKITDHAEELVDVDSAYLEDFGQWQSRYMYDLGLIIGGGTAQIQKNIIAERGLGLPREPRPAAV